MAEYQITYWRDLPSLVTVRDPSDPAAVTKLQLAPRFQEAIDEAAMRLGDTSSDDYLAGWRRSSWAAGAGDAADLAVAIVGQCEQEWPAERIGAYLDALQPSS